MSQEPTANSPIIISVAPNGARKTKVDHPNIPLSIDEIVREAKNCQEAGTVLIHLHIRDNQDKHTLNSEQYIETTAAIRKEVGDDLIIQVTSEAVGIYSPEEQMQMVHEVKPEAVSLAIRELFPDDSYETKTGEFLEWALNERIMPQYILYSDEDLAKYHNLAQRGIIPGDNHFLLFVLGRYSKGQISSPADLDPYLVTYQNKQLSNPWAVCAFGKSENECMLASSQNGGHVRIGFENNMFLECGTQANDNAALIQQFVASVGDRNVATIDEARQLLAL